MPLRLLSCSMIVSSSSRGLIAMPAAMMRKWAFGGLVVLKELLIFFHGSETWLVNRNSRARQRRQIEPITNYMWAAPWRASISSAARLAQP